VTHYEYSTYNAFDNNPVFWADPSGADASTGFGRGEQIVDYGDDIIAAGGFDNYQQGIRGDTALFHQFNQDSNSNLNDILSFLGISSNDGNSEVNLNQDWRLTEIGKQAIRIAEEYGGNAFEYYEFLEKHPIELQEDENGHHFIEIKGVNINIQGFDNFARVNLRSPNRDSFNGGLVGTAAEQGGQRLIKRIFKKIGGSMLSDGGLAISMVPPLPRSSLEDRTQDATFILEDRLFNKEGPLGLSFFDIFYGRR